VVQLGRPRRGVNTGTGNLDLGVQTTSPRRRPMGQVSVTGGAGGGEQTLTYTDSAGGTRSAGTMADAAGLVASLAASKYNAEAALAAERARAAALTQRLALLSQELAALQAVGEEAGGAALALTAAVTCAAPTSDVEKLCRMLLPAGDKLDEAFRLRGGSISAIGRNSASVAEMSERSQHDLAKLTQLLLSALLSKVKGGVPDPSGVFKILMKQRNGLQAELKAAVLSVDGVSPLNHPLCIQLKLAICRCKRLGMRDVARQLFSTVTAAMSEMGVTSSSLQDFFSDESELTVGEEVKVIVGRHRAYRLAQVVQVGGVDFSDGRHEGAGVLVRLIGGPLVPLVTVDFDDEDDMEVGGDESGRRHGADGADGADDTNGDDAGAATGVEGLQVVVSRDKIIAVGDVRITSYFVQESSKHAMAHFPGGRVEVPKRGVHILGRRRVVGCRGVPGDVDPQAAAACGAPTGLGPKGFAACSTDPHRRARNVPARGVGQGQHNRVSRARGEDEHALRQARGAAVERGGRPALPQPHVLACACHGEGGKGGSSG
jgi:hypothetical protein